MLHMHKRLYLGVVAGRWLGVIVYCMGIVLIGSSKGICSEFNPQYLVIPGIPPAATQQPPPMVQQTPVTPQQPPQNTAPQSSYDEFREKLRLKQKADPKNWKKNKQDIRDFFEKKLKEVSQKKPIIPEEITYYGKLLQILDETK